MPNPPKFSAGVPLPSTLRHHMETQLGDEFSDVRVYHDHSATLLGVNSYTEGNEIHFAPGYYNPHSSAGRDLIAHELSHVIQQRASQDDDD